MFFSKNSEPARSGSGVPAAAGTPAATSTRAAIIRPNPIVLLTSAALGGTNASTSERIDPAGRCPAAAGRGFGSRSRSGLADVPDRAVERPEQAVDVALRIVTMNRD